MGSDGYQENQKVNRKFTASTRCQGGRQAGQASWAPNPHPPARALEHLATQPQAGAEMGYRRRGLTQLPPLT